VKIAFIDNLPVGGGLSRFSLKLCKSLVEKFYDLEVDYYIHHSNLIQIPEIQHLSNRVNVKVLKTTRVRPRLLIFLNNICSRFLNFQIYSQNTIHEIETSIGYQYDLAYFPSAHMMKLPHLKIPIVGTWHDFNWKYFFGTEIFNNEFVRMMDGQVANWFEKGFCITSSNFIAGEGKKMYPNLKRYPTVIPIGQVVVKSIIESGLSDKILKSLNIEYPYIIFPGHFFPHKNHLNLFTAFFLLKQKPAFRNYKLLLTGVNTNKVERGIATYYGLRKIMNYEEDFDVVGLGYQPNDIIDVLIMKAKLLVSPSIYEAICTPAMDAWSFGTPTAISDIPPFREHETTWKIMSAFFDPMNPQNIADVIAEYLSNYERATNEAQISQQKLNDYSWGHISSEYMDVFKQALTK
jgi:glycosyltransferase involved in cell wall biosynthesis